MSQSLVGSLALECSGSSELDSLNAVFCKGKKAPATAYSVSREKQRPTFGADACFASRPSNTPFDLRNVPDADCSTQQCEHLDRLAKAELVKKTFQGAHTVQDQMARLKELVKVLGLPQNKPSNRQQAQSWQTKAEPVQLSLSACLAGVRTEDTSRSTSKKSNLSGKSTNMPSEDLPDVEISTCSLETDSDVGSISEVSANHDPRMEPMTIDLATTSLGYTTARQPYLKSMQKQTPLCVDPLHVPVRREHF